jgi:hypothetical protein
MNEILCQQKFIIESSGISVLKIIISVTILVMEDNNIHRHTQINQKQDSLSHPLQYRNFDKWLNHLAAE